MGMPPPPPPAHTLPTPDMLPQESPLDSVIRESLLQHYSRSGGSDALITKYGGTVEEKRDAGAEEEEKSTNDGVVASNGGKAITYWPETMDIKLHQLVIDKEYDFESVAAELVLLAEKGFASDSGGTLRVEDIDARSVRLRFSELTS